MIDFAISRLAGRMRGTRFKGRQMRLSLFLLLLLPFCVMAKDYSRLFEKLSPAVVTIHTVQTGVTKTSKGVAHTTAQGLGTGIIIDDEGTILTAAHVVDQANTVRIEMKDTRSFLAEVTSSVKVADLAVIRIKDVPPDLTYVRPGDSDKVNVGEVVFVIGAPYGLKHTLTTGNLSSRRVMEEAYLGDDLELLQTDAAINQGNSGGPLFSDKGELIGIVSHIKTKSGGSEGLGFAASINMAKNLILNHPPLWFGMEFTTLNTASLRMLNVPEYEIGLLVQHVAEGSLGDRFGVRAGTFPVEIEDQLILLGGDIIVAAGEHRFGASIETLEKVRDYFENVAVGDTLRLTVVRDGEKLILDTPKPDNR